MSFEVFDDNVELFFPLILIERRRPTTNDVIV